MAQTVKKPPAMQKTQVRSLGQEDPLKENVATTPVFFPGEFHEQKSLAGNSPWSCKESDMTEATKCTQACVCTHTHIHTGQNNGYYPIRTEDIKSSKK